MQAEMTSLIVMRTINIQGHVVIHYAVFAEQGKPIVIVISGKRVFESCLAVRK